MNHVALISLRRKYYFLKKTRDIYVYIRACFTEHAIANQKFAKTHRTLSCPFKGSIRVISASFHRLLRNLGTKEATSGSSVGLDFTDSVVTKLKPYRGKRIEGNSTVPSVQSSGNDRFRTDVIAYSSAEKLRMLSLLLYLTWMY